MIDWSQVFEDARPEPGASEEEIAAFLAELGRPLSPREVADVNRWNTNPFAPSDPLHAEWRPFDAAAWPMPDRPVPESYLSFLRYSNGGDFRNGNRLFQMYGTGLRQMTLDRCIPQYMPLALPFAFGGGGVMYLFDMRQPAVNGEYPTLCAYAGHLTFDPHYSPKVADGFLEVCRGRFNVERLRYGRVVLNAQTWETCTDPDTMLHECRGSRKLRLFAVACCRQVAHLLPELRFRHAVEVAERYAEREASDKERQAAKEACKKARGTPVYTSAAAAATEAVDSSADQAASDAARGAAVRSRLVGPVPHRRGRSRLVGPQRGRRSVARPCDPRGAAVRGNAGAGRRPSGGRLFRRGDSRALSGAECSCARVLDAGPHPCKGPLKRKPVSVEVADLAA
jgi:hypothetical protein